MNIIERKHEIFSAEWLSQNKKKEDIPDNSMFTSYFFTSDQQIDLNFLVKFKGTFYYFSKDRKKRDKLIKMKKNNIFFSRPSFNEINVVNIEDNEFDNFWKLYLLENQKSAERKADSYVLTEKDKEAFTINGIEPIVTKGARNYMRRSSAIIYDEVQYCIQFHSADFNENKKHIAEYLKIFNNIKPNVHFFIKFIYEFLKHKNLGDIWVLISSREVLFGNKECHFASLFIPNYNLEKYELRVTDSLNNSLFEDFKQENIILLLK